MTRAPLRAALVTAALWAAKAVAIGLAGGLGRSRLEGPFWLAGLAACVTTVVLLGLAVTEGRPTGVQILGVVGVLVVTIVFSVAETAVILAAAPPHPGWVWNEATTWVVAAALVAVTAALAVRRERVPLAVG